MTIPPSVFNGRGGLRFVHDAKQAPVEDLFEQGRMFHEWHSPV